MGGKVYHCAQKFHLDRGDGRHVAAGRVDDGRCKQMCLLLCELWTEFEDG